MIIPAYNSALSLGTAIQSVPPSQGTLKKLVIDGVERELIEQVLHACNGVAVNAAKRLGINRNTLQKKMELYRQPAGEHTPEENGAEE